MHTIATPERATPWLDVGGRQVGQACPRLLGLLERFGLATVDADRGPEPFSHHLGGHFVAGRDWAGSPHKPLSGDARSAPPHAPDRRDRALPRRSSRRSASVDAGCGASVHHLVVGSGPERAAPATSMDRAMSPDGPCR